MSRILLFDLVLFPEILALVSNIRIIAHNCVKIILYVSKKQCQHPDDEYENKDCYDKLDGFDCVFQRHNLKNLIMIVVHIPHSIWIFAVTDQLSLVNTLDLCHQGLCVHNSNDRA